jgi:hypothetical protein
VDFHHGLTLSVEQWQVVDVRFPGPLHQSLPDCVPRCVFTGPGDKRHPVSPFRDSGNGWVIRFSTGVLGSWTFCTHAAKDSLHGLTGHIEVVPNTRPDQHGAVVIAKENPKAFACEDATPHFMLAFEIDWLFALDYEDPGDLPKTRQILGYIRENGFTHVVMNIYASDVGWAVAGNVPEHYFYGRPGYGPFLGTNENPDFSGLNPRLFHHLDRVIALMQEMGLYAHLMIYVWNKKVNWPPMGGEADNLYFDHVIARYQAFSNVIWDVSKEALDYGRCDIDYISERIERLRAGDAFGRLVTVHDYEYNSREAGRVDFISIQSWRSELHAQMLKARERHPDKPVVNIEHGGYERGPYASFCGNYTSPETCLIRTYECLFAGVYGSYYWQNAAWNIVIHNPFDPGQSFDPPRFDYYRHLAGLFERYDFATLRPSHPKPTTNNRVGDDNFSTNGHALFDDSGLYLVWISGDAESTHAILPEPRRRMIEVTWFHPFTGEYRPTEAISWTGWDEFRSPWPGSASVLILRA